MEGRKQQRVGGVREAPRRLPSDDVATVTGEYERHSDENLRRMGTEDAGRGGGREGHSLERVRSDRGPLRQVTD